MVRQTAAAAVEQDSQNARSTRPAYAAEVGPSFERPDNPASRSGILEEIKKRNQERGGLRADARGNVRCRCPFCEHKSNSFVWSAEHHGGAFHCFHCGESGGWKKLAQQYGIVKRRRRTDAGVFGEWQTIALTRLDWRGLVRRFSDAEQLERRAPRQPGERRAPRRRVPSPTAITRAATAAARTYIALVGIAAKAGTVTPAASTRTIAEMTGASRQAVQRSLVVLRRAGLLSQDTHWMARTLQDRARRAPIYLVRDPRRANLVTGFLCRSGPDRSEATAIPEASTGPILTNSVAWRRGGVSHADFSILTHLERGPTTQKSLGAATGFSQSTISRSLRKLAGLDVVRRDHRQWERTSRTLADVVDGPAFDQARAAADRQRLRHQMERQRFDHGGDLDRVLGVTKRLILRDGISPARTLETGHQARQDNARATITGQARQSYAPRSDPQRTTSG